MDYVNIAMPVILGLVAFFVNSLRKQLDTSRANERELYKEISALKVDIAVLMERTKGM